METLYLLRHAKSSWDDPALRDFDRPLNGRGDRAARFMGDLMLKNGLVPDLIVCSPSKRTRMTLELLLETSHFESNVVIDERIYEATPGDLAAAIDEHAKAARALMIICHNPGIESVIRYLSGIIEPMPTAALAVLERVDGSEFPFAVRHVYRPRELMAND